MTAIETPIREHLLASLRGGQAFDSPKEILAQIPQNKRFEPASPTGRSPWQIVEHMRLTLEDLIAYSNNFDGSYKPHKWPDDYWPKIHGSDAPEAWDRSVQNLFDSLKRFETLIADPNRNLFEPFSWAKGHTLLREALLAIEHTAYHCGELVEWTMVESP